MAVLPEDDAGEGTRAALDPQALEAIAIGRPVQLQAVQRQVAGAGLQQPATQHLLRVLDRCARGDFQDVPVVLRTIFRLSPAALPDDFR